MSKDDKVKLVKCLGCLSAYYIKKDARLKRYCPFCNKRVKHKELLDK